MKGVANVGNEVQVGRCTGKLSRGEGRVLKVLRMSIGIIPETQLNKKRETDTDHDIQIYIYVFILLFFLFKVIFDY